MKIKTLRQLSTEVCLVLGPQDYISLKTEISNNGSVMYSAYSVSTSWIGPTGIPDDLVELCKAAISGVKNDISLEEPEPIPTQVELFQEDVKDIDAIGRAKEDEAIDQFTKYL